MGTNENSRNLTKQRETTGDSYKNGRRPLRRFFHRNRKIFRVFNFRGFILTAKYRENWKTAKISAYTVLKHIRLFDFMCTRRLNESMTNDFLS